MTKNTRTKDRYKYFKKDGVYIIKRLTPQDIYYKPLLVVNNEATAKSIIKLIEDDMR